MTEQEQIKYEIAKKQVKKIKGFYTHLFAYIVVNLFFIINKALNRGLDEFFSFSTFSIAFYWAIGLFFHAFNVFVKDIFLGKNWEERKIKEFLEEEKKKGWD